MNRLRAPTLALLLAIAPVSVPSALADSLAAVSSTAMAITGDIEFDDFSIVFENGETLEFDELVADNFNVEGSQVGASVYSVTSPADPELNNGNRLCGQGDVTYVATWGDPSDAELTIVAVFDTQDAPLRDSEMCASYTYVYK
ncbi:MAG: hypothetical protein Q8S27_17360 [Hoeflea sp.]|uniref:hypothetical protein n=1 Tax=Hoeflea sp. TaxID=1940281 RepID=UPI0027307F49|nr:hypothetical protein [Hoeflea sp.]MDP2122205.1 hypothetical protein [Hoeflea sp.]MDP3526348.1 hypothetical protein [Hoeflea sp.]